MVLPDWGIIVIVVVIVVAVIIITSIICLKRRQRENQQIIDEYKQQQPQDQFQNTVQLEILKRRNEMILDRAQQVKQLMSQRQGVTQQFTQQQQSQIQQVPAHQKKRKRVQRAGSQQEQQDKSMTALEEEERQRLYLETKQKIQNEMSQTVVRNNVSKQNDVEDYIRRQSSEIIERHRRNWQKQEAEKQKRLNQQKEYEKSMQQQKASQQKKLTINVNIRHEEDHERTSINQTPMSKKNQVLSQIPITQHMDTSTSETKKSSPERRRTSISEVPSLLISTKEEKPPIPVSPTGVSIIPFINAPPPPIKKRPQSQIQTRNTSMISDNNNSFSKVKNNSADVFSRKSQLSVDDRSEISVVTNYSERSFLTEEQQIARLAKMRREEKLRQKAIKQGLDPNIRYKYKQEQSFFKDSKSGIVQMLSKQKRNSFYSEDNEQSCSQSQSYVSMLKE